MLDLRDRDILLNILAVLIKVHNLYLCIVLTHQLFDITAMEIVASFAVW